MQVSLSPVVWRDFEAPHRVMVNLGLRSIEMESDSCYPASMYSAFNPRVVTTGMDLMLNAARFVAIAQLMRDMQPGEV